MRSKRERLACESLRPLFWVDLRPDFVFAGQVLAGESRALLAKWVNQSNLTASKWTLVVFFCFDAVSMEANATSGVAQLPLTCYLYRRIMIMSEPACRSGAAVRHASC